MDDNKQTSDENENQDSVISLTDTWSSLSLHERREAFQNLPRTDAEELFLNLRTHDQAELISEAGPLEKRSWIRLLAPDDVADLIQEMGLDMKEELLSLLDPQTRREVTVLLAYAEAKNEVSGPDATIYDALNKIRSRTGVGLPAVDQTKYNSKDLLREFIRHERRIELAMEGHRYFDLKRWGIMAAKLATVKNPAGVTLLFGEKNNVLPFPQGEIDKNQSLIQNPGY